MEGREVEEMEVKKREGMKERRKEWRVREREEEEEGRRGGSGIEKEG